MRKIWLMIVMAVMAGTSMAETTPNLVVELMASGEAQPHLTFNDLAWVVDAFAQGRLAAYPANASPVVNDATEGDLFIVPAAVDSATPEGDWADRDNDLALYKNGDWAFFTPKVGWRVQDATEGHELAYDGDSWEAENRAWVTLQEQASTPADPAENRAVIWMDASGNLRALINPAGVVKEATVVTFSSLP